MSLTIVVATAGPTPAAGDETFASIKQQIAAVAGRHRDSKALTLAGAFVRDRIDDLNRLQTWTFNLVTSPTITTSPGVSSYAVPADFWKVYNARKTSDPDYQLSTIRQKTFDTLFASQRSIVGYPYLLIIKNTFRGATVQFFPTPSAAFDLSINYYKLIQKPASDSDFLDLPLPYQGVVKYHAMMRMAALGRDSQQQQMYGAMADRAYAEMMRSDDDVPDENLRFTHIEELSYRSSYMDPAIRPRAYDLW